jgi:hypothetical protein
MKTEENQQFSAQVSDQGRGDQAKLLSLMALGAGAIAMPQMSQADIVWTDLSSNPANVGFSAGFGSTFLIDTLPGGAQLRFRTFTHTTAITTTRRVTAIQAAGYVRLKTNGSFVIPASQGKTWNQIPGLASLYGFVGRANFNRHGPNSFDHLYFAFLFKDATQGNLLCYGWVEASLRNPSNAGNPDLTIFGYAYDNSGAFIPMGATPPVPEPGSMALMALGALALGAKGVRSWRRNRPAPGQS